MYSMIKMMGDNINQMQESLKRTDTREERIEMVPVEGTIEVQLTSQWKTTSSWFQSKVELN